MAASVAFTQQRQLGAPFRTPRLNAVRAGHTVPAHARTALGVETAEQLLVLAHQPARLFGVRRRNDIALLVLRDSQQAIQIVQFVDRRPDRCRQVLVEIEAELSGALYG